LDIPFKTFDFSDQYKKEVVDYMISEYKAGRTPNPDIMCNRHVKFGSFLKQAIEDGVDHIATGHYAQNISRKDGTFSMTESKDKNKDQTYFLWTLNQDDLKHVLFPIGHLEKSEVRKLAEKYNLPVFDKKDSQGVCFIGHLDMKGFLKEYIHPVKGDVLDQSGTVVGEHDGCILYTIGERHGFRIFNATPDSQPHYIVSKNIDKNTITVSTEEIFLKEMNEILPKEAEVIDISWVGEKPMDGAEIGVRIRYRQEQQMCKIEHQGDMIRVKFDKPQKGLASGQSAVFYDGEVCLGGGILR
jgi:tRNA-specific 2-thiouridylase